MGNVEDLGSFRAPSPAVDSEEGKVLVLVSEVFKFGSGLKDEKDETIGVDSDVVTAVGVVVVALEEESVVSVEVGLVIGALEVALLVPEINVVVVVTLGFVVTTLRVGVIALGVVFVMLEVVIKGDVYS